MFNLSLNSPKEQEKSLSFICMFEVDFPYIEALRK